MTINDIKLEALKLMFLNYSEDISDVNALTTDENYSAYIMNMNGAINRALGRFWAKRVIHKMFKPLPSAFEGIDDNLDLCDYCFAITETEEAEIRESVKAEYPDLTEELLQVKQDLAVALEKENRRTLVPIDAQLLIPYWIKADLYEEDEPALSAQARNIFEQGIEDRQYEDAQDCIENVFRSGWLG